MYWVCDDGATSRFTINPGCTYLLLIRLKVSGCSASAAANLNVRGLLGALLDLNGILGKCKPYVVALTETWLGPGGKHPSVYGYDVIARQDRCSRIAGGV